MGILCMLGIHKWKKFFTENANDSVVYLECVKCRKRKWKARYESFMHPLDNEWLNGKTFYPKFPKKPQPK